MKNSNTVVDTFAILGMTIYGIMALSILARIFGLVTWSWWWILSPIWIPVGMAVAFCIMGLLIMVHAEMKDQELEDDA